MKTTSKTVLALSLFSLLPFASVRADDAPAAPSTAAPAAKRPGEVNRRLHRQNRRINQGVKSGELTRREAHRLRKEDRTVHKEEKDMRAVNGGKLTPADKAALNQQENKVSRNIHRQKHDAQKR